MVSGFISCLDPSMIASSLLCLTLQTHVEVRQSTWTVQVSTWSLPVHMRLFWVHHGRERPVQLSHFSNSFAVTSGFTVTFGLVEHPHAWQAEIGIFELISCLVLSTSAMLDSILCPTLQTHVEAGPFNLDSSGFCIVSCSTVACCLDRRATDAHVSLFRFPRGFAWFWCDFEFDRA